MHYQRDNHTVMTSFRSAHNKSMLNETYDHIYLSVWLFICLCMYPRRNLWRWLQCLLHNILWQSSLWSTKIITLFYLNNFEYFNELQSKNSKIWYWQLCVVSALTIRVNAAVSLKVIFLLSWCFTCSPGVFHDSACFTTMMHHHFHVECQLALSLSLAVICVW